MIEDAPSGVKSGVAAGSRVLAVCTSHAREQLEGLGASWIVTDLSKSVHIIPQCTRIRLINNFVGFESCSKMALFISRLMRAERSPVLMCLDRERSCICICIV